MGMAASQGRLLMMTARLSNNEFEQQCVAYSKQRLADKERPNDWGLWLADRLLCCCQRYDYGYW